MQYQIKTLEECVERDRVDLWGADLRRAYLQGAEGLDKYINTPLYMLIEQPGVIRAYKIVNKKMTESITAA